MRTLSPSGKATLKMLVQDMREEAVAIDLRVSEVSAILGSTLVAEERKLQKKIRQTSSESTISQFLSWKELQYSSAYPRDTFLASGDKTLIYEGYRYLPYAL